MKQFYCVLFLCLIFNKNTISQTSITAVSISTAAAPSTNTYTNGGFTYNWGISPNNTEETVTGFTSGGKSYVYANSLTGNLKFRRVDNAGISGNFTLIWAEAVDGPSTYNLFPRYDNDMEPFFNSRIYNKGTDNLFDNTSSNKNNIERLDWLLVSPQTFATPSKIGFAIFERGAAGAHDPFCISAITSVDVSGNPSGYGNIVRISSTNYGDPGPSLYYRILKEQYPNNLLDAGTNTQSRGGVFVSLQDLGIAAGQTIYGYSLFSSDLPLSATPTNLVDYTNSTYFPTNTGNPGGIDLLAITGIFFETTVLPVKFTGFTAVENQNLVELKWSAENENAGDYYEVERSVDGGLSFSPLTGIPSKTNPGANNAYSYSDNISTITIDPVLYRIKHIEAGGKFLYSKTISIIRNTKHTELFIYPNPVKDNLQINILNHQQEIVRIIISNSNGKQIIQKNINLNEGRNAVSLSEVAAFPSGSYIFTLYRPDGISISKKFIKQ